MCFRLYTKAFYDTQMPIITLPEIQRTSLVSAVLYLKSLEVRTRYPPNSPQAHVPPLRPHCLTECSSRTWMCSHSISSTPPVAHPSRMLLSRCVGGSRGLSGQGNEVLSEPSAQSTSPLCS